MRRLSVVVALAVTGCALEGIPRDRMVEATFPRMPPVAELPRQLKVATFNVHMEPGEKVANAIASDRALRDLDLIIVEEVPRWSERCSGACAIGKRLGFYSIFAAGHHDPDGKDVGLAILSKAPITSAQILELPWNDVHFNAGRRIALVATMLQDGRPITVYAVHLENRLTVAERRRQMTPILEHARQQPTPVIIGGDFNTNPFTWISHWLPIPTGTQGERLEELVRAYGFDTPVTDSGPTHRYIGMRLDGIYTRGFETRRFATAHARDVSDHLALWATLATKTATTATRIAPTSVATKAH